MKSEIYREVLKQLEPGDYAFDPTITTGEMAELSQAISLRRIADALADTLMILTHPVIEASPGFDPKVES